jgi:hypothetical protein
MTYKKEKGRLKYIDVIRFQDGKIHVLGRRKESISSDGSFLRAYHIIYDAPTGKVISEDSFMYRGNFPLFMCGCYILSCEGKCPPLLDHELAMKINENKIKADRYNNSMKKFQEANLNDLRKTVKNINFS